MKNNKQKAIDYNLQMRFIRTYAKKLLVQSLIKKYNNLLDEKDLYMLVGMYEAICGEVRGCALCDDEVVKMLTEICSEDITELLKKYETRGKQVCHTKRKA